MGARSPDAESCPVCGQEYDQRVVVERGDAWSDVFAGTPLSFFRRYQRRCSSQFDVETERERSGSECVVYFHEGHEGHSLF
jgi:hypothetical protein